MAPQQEDIVGKDTSHGSGWSWAHLPSPVYSLCLFQGPRGLEKEELGNVSTVQIATAPESAGQCSQLSFLELTGSTPQVGFLLRPLLQWRAVCLSAVPLFSCPIDLTNQLQT